MLLPAKFGVGVQGFGEMDQVGGPLRVNGIQHALALNCRGGSDGGCCFTAHRRQPPITNGSGGIQPRTT